MTLPFFQPEKALEVYRIGLKLDGRDSILASKIGQALIKTHHYNKAIIYYETALKSEAMPFLRLDLADLLLNLNLFERAEKTLNVVLEQELPTALEQVIERVKYIVLLSKVYNKAGKHERALSILGGCFSLQTK